MTAAGGAVAAARRAAFPAAWGWLAAGLAGLLAGGIRFALAFRSFDTFGDEVIYAGLGRSVMSGGWPRNQEGPFFLHPPGFFYLEAGWARLLPRPGDPVAAVYQMRALNIVLAAVTAAVLVLLVRRIASLPAAVAAGLLFATDPFCIRQNDRVLLETATMMWVLLGYLVLTSVISRPLARGSYARAAGAGLLFGGAVLTKDQAALLTVLPMLAAAAAGWAVRRRLALVAAGVPAVVYGAYVAAAAATGQLSTLWYSKTTGARRLLGLEQITGFNRPGSPSLLTRLAAEAGYFWTTYLIVLLAVPALVLLLRRRDPGLRLAGLLAAAALVTLGYAVAVGTIEEVQLYLLVLPAMIVVTAGSAAWLAGRRRGRQTARRGPRGGTLAAAAVALLLCANLATCVRWLVSPDTGYARLRQYLAAHVPAGAAVISVDDSPPSTRGSTYWLLSDRYRVGRWVSPAARARAHARYVVVPWGEVDQRYSYLTPAQVRALVRPGRLLFSFRERTYGELALYQLPLPGR